MLSAGAFWDKVESAQEELKALEMERDRAAKLGGASRVVPCA